jgi:predicted nucleotidyltransferase
MDWNRDFDQDESLRMQTDISRLPEAKQRELEQITEIIRAQGEVEMVILFGSYARGDWREEKDLEPDRWSGHASDYDILVVVKEPQRAADAGYRRTLLETTNALKFSTHAHPIVHDIDDVNANLEEGRYFFMDIKREGCLLYDSERYRLAEPRELSNE